MPMTLSISEQVEWQEAYKICLQAVIPYAKNFNQDQRQELSKQIADHCDRFIKESRDRYATVNVTIAQS